MQCNPFLEKKEMSTLPMHPNDTVEFLDDEEVLREKVRELARMLQQSKHAVGFTGAGVSTAAGIPDFRSGIGTMSASGPGVWELAARGLTPIAGQRRCTRHTMAAVPTNAHMMLVGLEKRGIIKHLVSVNTDGLHRRSGFPSTKLTELYGNINTERCPDCGKVFLRDYFARRVSNAVHDHSTGRSCHCGAGLQDTIVNFNEPLTTELVKSNLQCCDDADLCVVLGSSLHLAPGADIPTMVRNKGGRLVIVNLQSTPMDVNADLVIHAKCEDVARMLMQELHIAAAPWKLQRQLIFNATPVDPLSTDGNVCTIVIEGRDMEGHPIHVIKDIAVTSPNMRDLPFKLHDTHIGRALTVSGVQDGQLLSVELRFFGHYNEPPLVFDIKVGPTSIHRAYAIHLDPRKAPLEWEVLLAPELL